MALFNKFFSSRKTNSNNNNENNSDKHFAFTKEQVRVVLFRECDFRGRKLLFDSTAVKKVEINVTMDTQNHNSVTKDQTEAFAEISDGYGYMYVKPPTDSTHLADMIFGLVAMSYRGSYFKIHNLDTPTRLMFTQVFPSPKFGQRRKTSTSSHGRSRTSSQSLEHSMRLEDSGTSMSVHSTASDTLLVCRRCPPSDVPQKLSGSSLSMISDSGVYGERSYSSCDVNRQSGTIPAWETFLAKGSATSFSNSTLYKRWLRSSSLEHSVTSSTGSIDENFTKTHQRTSKLGLALIVQLTIEQEGSQRQFFMEHIALLESLLWRARQTVETAYLHPNNFLSVLVKMVNLIADWLSNLISGPLLPLNYWTSLYCSSSNNYTNSDNFNRNISDCDNNNSIIINSAKYEKETSDMFKTMFSKSSKGFFQSEMTRSLNMLSENQSEKYEFTFQNITKIIKNEWESLNSKIFGHLDRDDSAGRFVQEFCELLDVIDAKDTNFFMSTLITAVLTHHLGWVATCLPSENDTLDVNMPFNPLWGQLSDLYGAIGHPTKMAQTIIMGNKRKEIITKIINCLTYFIRCCDLERNNIIRSNIYDDNKIADYICQENACIPKENFKKYKDHLREIWEDNDASKNTSDETRNTKHLVRSKKSQFDLSNLGQKKIGTDLRKSINSTNLKALGSSVEKLTCLEYQEEKLEKDVVFVLGDDEKLVDIKRNETEDEINKLKRIARKESSSRSVRKPNFLDLIFKKYETFEEEFSRSNFKDDDFSKDESDTCIKPSTSWASLQQAINAETYTKTNVRTLATFQPEKPFVRSQSVPPECKEKVVKEEIKAKYKYAGVKFSLHQYPQVVTNYMRSKNLEMANLPFSEITKKFDQISADDEINLDFSQYDVNSNEMEALQTPSNASELEFTNDSGVEQSEVGKSTSFPNSTLESPVEDGSKMQIIYFPMPKSETTVLKTESMPYRSSLMRGTSDNYIPNLVLQGTSAPKKNWESNLKNELALNSQHCLLDNRLEEAVAIVADTDTWEVHLMSSHTYVIDKGSSGVRVGMSQLIASMLDSLLKMWKLQVPPHLCLQHIEQRLQVLCMRSKALAQLLLSTEFCSMEFLTSTLHLEVNDVPLLMAVASTYSPQVTQKYGISFQ